MATINKITKLTDKRFVNLYQADGVNSKGYESHYLIASRSESVEGLKMNSSLTRPDAVAIYAVCDDKVVLVRQYRYPINGWIYEFPAGLVEDGEDYHDTAIRELKEETGLTADDWTCLGLFYPAAAYCDEVITMYLARGLHKGTQELDDDEFLDVHRIPLVRLVEDIMEGKVPDAKTQTAVLKAARILGCLS